MTDHLEQAAARASELVGELDQADAIAVVNAQRHLTYLAGLLRGGALRPSPARTWEMMKADARDRLRQQRARPWTCDADPGDHDPIKADTEPAQGEIENLRRQLKFRETYAITLKRELTAEIEELQRQRDEALTAIEWSSKQEDYRQRWHEAATQRDALVRAARELLRDETMVQTTRVDRLRAVVERVAANDAPAPLIGFEQSNALRRELWAVLGHDLVPSTDAELIAAVRELKAGRDEAIRQRKKTADVMERARAQRDELLAAIETFIDAPAEWGPRADLANAANRVLSDKA